MKEQLSVKTEALAPVRWEEWRAIPGYSHYSASSLGRIRRETASPRAVAGYIKRLSNDGRYGITRLYADSGMLHSRRVHILVALAWLGVKPTPEHEVNHINGDKLDNRPENLEYVTSYENEMHAKRHGLKASGERWHALRAQKALSDGEASL